MCECVSINMEDINQEDPPIGVDQGDSEGNPCVICPFESYIDQVPGLTIISTIMSGREKGGKVRGKSDF